MIELDDGWCAAHPLPAHDGETDKKSRGRLLVVGGAKRTPGVIRLTGEAALRVGAGRVRLATLESSAATLGAAFPEAGIVALPEDDSDIAAAAGPLVAEQAAEHHAVVLGPGMANKDAAARLIRALAEAPAKGTHLVLDAAAVACAGPLCDLLECYAGRLVLTPHEGEMAGLLERDVAEVSAAREKTVQEAAAKFRAVVLLKGSQTLIAAPDGTLLHYRGGGVGLATAGSGDVLAGVIGGLLARGADPLTATGWGVWLHGEAGQTLARDVAPIGFLARDLLPVLPGLLPR
jgi:ADP-dependent NAD(P)H-hydrate dehydratase